MRIALEANAGGFEISSDNARILGDTLVHLGLGFDDINLAELNKDLGTFTATQGKVIRGNEDLIRSAIGVGASTDQIGQGHLPPRHAGRARRAVPATVHQGDRAALPTQQEVGGEQIAGFAEKLKLEEDAIKAINEELAKEADRVKEFVETVASFEPIGTGDKGLGDFTSTTEQNLATMEKFFGDLDTLIQRGAILAAQRFAEIGPESQQALSEALKAPVSEVAKLEEDLARAVLLGKRGMDDAFGQFKPNLEDVTQENFVGPILANIAVVQHAFESGIDPSALLGHIDIIGGQVREMGDRFTTGLSGAQQALIDLARRDGVRRT